MKYNKDAKFLKGHSVICIGSPFNSITNHPIKDGKRYIVQEVNDVDRSFQYIKVDGYDEWIASFRFIKEPEWKKK